MKRQNLSACLSKRHRQLGILKMEILLLLAVTLLLPTQLSAEDWMQLYPEIDGPVADMEFSEIPGISEYGLIFAIADSGGGLGYFDSPGNFSIFSIATNLGAVSVASDNTNNRIFCAFGCGSYSDGLYEFDVATHQFELITWTEDHPNFVKKLSSGFYYGYGCWCWYGGLLYSPDGDNWANIDYFNNKVVRDIEETSDGTLFVAVGNEICIANDTTFSSFDTYLPVNDIYVRHHPTEEVYIAIGDGSWSDGIYKVEYEDGEITGLTLINWAVCPNKIYEYDGLYEDWLVVGCLYSGGLWLVEPVEIGEIHQIGTELDFEDVYCFETYPMYCPNIMVGMDTGIYLGTNLLLTLPVYLSVFEAYWNSSDNVSIIHWRTESETDVIGFNLYRNDEDDFSTALKINVSLIPGHGTTTVPHDYYYEDDGIEPNPMDEYWYWLESIDIGGVSHIYYPPANLVIPNCVLSTFTVQYLDNIPIIYWVTQSETDNAGWNIYRSINDSSFENAAMINAGLIPGYGTTTEPHSYCYEDLYVSANPGDVLWYWLESIDLGGVCYVYYPPANLVIPNYISVFEAHWNSSDEVANIHWRTEYETDVLGFNIYRNDEPNFTTSVQVNIDLIPGHGSTTVPHDYYYEDDGIEPYPMDEYWYWLESVDLGGETSHYGPTNLIIPNCDLSVFTAQYLDNVVTLYWVTQSETDNMGWNIYRSINDSSFENAAMINIGLIPGQGTTSEPTNYIYTDEDVEANPGDVLWYWLESIDLGGGSHIYYPPASLVIPVIGIDERPAHSSGVVLYQNYPNPFSGSTTIFLNLATKPHENTQIKIYNVKGQLVKTLECGESLSTKATESLYSISWKGRDENGNQLSNGIYLYYLESNNYKSKTKKMILLR